MAAPRDDPKLTALLAQSVAAVKAMTPAEREAMHEAQRKSWVRAELAFGSDADEARYRMAEPAERECLDAWSDAYARWRMGE